MWLYRGKLTRRGYSLPFGLLGHNTEINVITELILMSTADGMVNVEGIYNFP